MSAAAKDPIVIVHRRSGSRCTINPFGAHLTSYRTSADKELLFLSRDAILDGSRAIRGGIPICFPRFGQPDRAMPQHGFLRNNYWTEVSGSRHDDDEYSGISLELYLKNAVNARGGHWGTDTKFDVRCTYTVKIDGSGFETKIVIENLGETSWNFQVLLHNYFLVRDGTALNGEMCNVKGLGGYAVHDKVSGERYVLGPDPVTVPEDMIIDREYTPSPHTQGGVIDLDLTVSAGPSNRLSLKASGEVDGNSVPVSGVVWNPHRDNARAMVDFGDDEYVDMICVEPGLLSHVPMLEGGKKASFTQIVRCL